MPKKSRSYYQVDLEIEFDGLDEMVATFDNMIDAIDDNLESGLNEYMALVEEGSKKLAPRDQGDLEDRGIVGVPARWENGALTASVGANLEYALRRHEDPYKPGVRPKYDNGIKVPGYYVDGRGAETRQKSAWRGEEPGRKYISRAVLLTQDDFREIMQDALKKTLRGRRR